MHRDNNNNNNNDNKSLDIPDPFLSGPETNLNKWTQEQEN